MESQAAGQDAQNKGKSTNTIDQLLANCAKEDLAHIGHIQPFSYLLEISADEHRLLACSENIEELTGTPYADCIGRTISEVFGESIEPEKLEVLQHKGAQLTVPNAVNIGELRYHLSVQHLVSTILIEIEKPGHIKLSDSERQSLIHRPLKANEASSLNTIVEEFASRFWSMTGFDRILVYQFMDDWSGKVVFEKGDYYEPSMLGLHFPASDIPPNARKLYESMPSRLIADVQAHDVRIHKPDSLVQPDQTRSRARSCSKAHLLYLKNMGVRSSFSCSIMFKNQLWGLIACHHHEPFLPDLRVRLDCERLSRALAVELMRVHAERRMQMIENFKFGANSLLDQLPTRLTSSRDFLSVSTSLMELLDADGFAVVRGRDVLSAGNAPSEDELLILQDLVASKTENRYFKVERLASIYPSSISLLPRVAGMLAIGTTPLSRTTNEDFIFYWFRSEYVSSIDWAGKNSKGTDSLKLSDGTDVLSPRKSFEIWTEEKKQNSRPWSSEQVFKANLWVHNLSRRFSYASVSDSELELGENMPFR